MINNQKNQIVSVIMSVYNDEKNIQNSIESILNQTYKNIELLLVDDGSTDNTYKIINSISDKRLKIFKNKANIGLTKSLNFLINKTNSDFIARQDSDDISFDKRIEIQMETILSNKYDAVFSRAIIKDSNLLRPKFSYYIPKKYLIKYKNPFIHGTLLIKKQVLINLGMYNEKFLYAQDYKLMRSFIDNNYTFKIIKQPLYILNTKNNISSIMTQQQEYYANIVRKNIEL